MKLRHPPSPPVKSDDVSPALSRRFALTQIASGAFVALLPAQSLAAKSALADGGSAMINEWIVHRESIAKVGIAVRASGAIEETRDQLTEVILNSIGVQPQRSIEVDPMSIRHALSDRIREDFANGNMVFVDGWALSRTEARVCAFVAMDGTHDAEEIA